MASTSHKTSSSSDRRQKHAQQVLASQAAQKAEEKLRNTGEFICDIRFSNILPDIPFEPKCLAYPIDGERFVKYQTSSLERQHRPHLHANKDLGIPIDLVTMHRAAQPAAAELPAVAPEDAELIRLVDEVTEKTSKKPQGRRGAALNSNVSWLLKTKYIANDLYDPVHKVRQKIRQQLQEVASGRFLAFFSLPKDKKEGAAAGRGKTGGGGNGGNDLILTCLCLRFDFGLTGILLICSFPDDVYSVQPMSTAAEQARQAQRLRERADAEKANAKTLLERIKQSFAAAAGPVSALVRVFAVVVRFVGLTCLLASTVTKPAKD